MGKKTETATATAVERKPLSFLSKRGQGSRQFELKVINVEALTGLKEEVQGMFAEMGGVTKANIEKAVKEQGMSGTDAGVVLLLLGKESTDDFAKLAELMELSTNSQSVVRQRYNASKKIKLLCDGEPAVADEAADEVPVADPAPETEVDQVQFTSLTEDN